MRLGDVIKNREYIDIDGILRRTSNVRFTLDELDIDLKKKRSLSLTVTHLMVRLLHRIMVLYLGIWYHYNNGGAYGFDRC